MTEAEKIALNEKLKKSVEAFGNMSPAEREAMLAEQAKSWVRSCAPCEHGIRDWETCPDCRRRALEEGQG